MRTGGLLIGGLLASVLASLFLAQKMVAPIKVLRDGAARIAGGALDQTIEIHTGDELEELGQEFNRMTARLRVSNAGMEQKVRDLGVAYTELENKNLQLEDAQGQLVRTEKLAAIVNANKKKSFVRQAALPGFMLACYLILFFYFKARGGYKPVDLHA